MEPRVYLRAGLTLDWRGYSLYDRAVMACELPLQESHTTAITSSAYRRIEMQPGEQTKKLRLLRQLGSRQINGSVWLCETVDKAGQPVQVVLKLFSSALHPYGAWSTLQNTMPDTRQSEPEYMYGQVRSFVLTLLHC